MCGVFVLHVYYRVQTDAWFEIISVVMQMAIWHTKHAANISSSDT